MHIRLNVLILWLISVSCFKKGLQPKNDKTNRIGNFAVEVLGCVFVKPEAICSIVSLILCSTHYPHHSP